MKLAALEGFAQLSSFTNLTFTEAAEGQVATIRISQTADPEIGIGAGSLPVHHYAAGDIWFGRSGEPYEQSLAGSWGFPPPCCMKSATRWG